MMIEWLGQQLFRYVHEHYLVYGACWEDPRIDREALGIGPGDRLLVITSAGCNVLDYLLEQPARIDAVDLNYRQNALLDLKLAAIAELEWEDFFAMFGQGHDPLVRRRYHNQLRRRLTARHQRFWDRHIGLFCGRRPFYHRTTSGWFAAWFRWYIRYVVRLEAPVLKLLAAGDLHEQRAIYDRELRDHFWRPLLARCLQRDAVLALSGIPPEQRRQVQRHQPDLLAYLKSRAEHVIYHLPLRENYFWRAYIVGAFTPQCCPRYLQPAHFPRLKSLADRISFASQSVRHYLETHTGAFTHYVLLDHMDWLAGSRFAELEGEWQAIVDRAEPGARVLWRSLGLRTDYLHRVRVRVNGHQRLLADVLEYNHQLASALQPRERVNAYGCLQIATLRHR